MTVTSVRLPGGQRWPQLCVQNYKWHLSRTQKTSGVVCTCLPLQIVTFHCLQDYTLTQAEITVTEIHPTDSVDVDGHVEVPVLLEAGGGGRAQPGAGVVRLLGPDPALQTRPRRVV